MAVKSISKRRSAVQSVVLPLIFGAALITAWQTGLLHILLNTDEYVLPYPTRIITIISENTDKIMVNVWASVQVAVLGLLLGSLLGYLIAIFAFGYELAMDLMKPEAGGFDSLQTARALLMPMKYVSLIVIVLMGLFYQVATDVSEENQLII